MLINHEKSIYYIDVVYLLFDCYGLQVVQRRITAPLENLISSGIDTSVCLFSLITQSSLLKFVMY